MALPAKRWPLYAEEHRAEADACAEQSSKHLAASAKLLAEAIAAIKRGNPVQAELLITRAQLENAQADALQERIRRVLEVARHGRD
mgnify:CR=1 FL=1